MEKQEKLPIQDPSILRFWKKFTFFHFLVLIALICYVSYRLFLAYVGVYLSVVDFSTMELVGVTTVVAISAPLILATNFVLFILIHEHGHWIALQFTGYKGRLVFFKLIDEFFRKLKFNLFVAPDTIIAALDVDKNEEMTNLFINLFKQRLYLKTVKNTIPFHKLILWY